MGDRRIGDRRAKENGVIKIKFEDGYLADDDTISDEIIHLGFAEDSLHPSKKQQKALINFFFWILQAVSLALVCFHKALFGILVYILGSLLLWWLKRLNPENSNKAADIIDAIRLFFVALSPTFKVEDATKKQQ